MKTGKNDLFLIAGLLGAGIIMLLIFFLCGSNAGYVTVSIDGGDSVSYPLGKDKNVDIDNGKGGINRLVIKSGSAYLEDANCPDKLCVHMGKIDKTGQSIICLPNRVTIRIEAGKEESELDAVAGGTSGNR